MAPQPPLQACPLCGAANAPYATFCHECGEPFAAGGAPRGLAPARSGPARREMALGALLVLAVLLFALGDWWQREARERTYQAGVQAAARHEWEAAAAVFSSLGAYQDAARRHAEATANLQRRDTSYEAGRLALATGNPFAAAQAFSATQAIQPTYRDTAALYAQAVREVGQVALAHTIYRRVGNGVPGLVLRPPGGADYGLPGSDGRSQVWLADPAGGRVIYDGPVPGANGAPQAPAPAVDPAQPPRLPPDRQLLLAGVGPAAGPPQVLPRALGRGGQLALGPTGIWWYARRVTPDPQRYPWDALLDNGLETLMHYDFQEQGIVTVPLTGGDYYLLDAAPGAGRVLIGQYGSPQAPAPRTQLYLAGPARRTLQPLTQLPGAVYWARLSADGNYILLLYNARASLPANTKARLVLGLIDLGDPAYPFQEWAVVDLGSIIGSGQLWAAFVPGAGPPQALIHRVAGATVQMWTQDAATGEVRGLWGDTPILWLAQDRQGRLVSDGQRVLVWTREGTNIWMVDLPLDGRRATIQQAGYPPDSPLSSFSAGGSLSAGAIYGDRVLYQITGALDGGTGAGVTLYTQRIADSSPPFTLLLQQPPAPDGAAQVRIQPSGLVVYAGPQATLWARTLDGTGDLPLLAGADALWAFDPP